ncbi:MAG: hypothetical protein ACWIPJ_11020, partial [Polaribacter sp.]
MASITRKSIVCTKPFNLEFGFYHYRKGCLSGVLKDCWIQLLKVHKQELDLSSVDLDGSHTPAIRGGVS